MPSFVRRLLPLVLLTSCAPGALLSGSSGPEPELKGSYTVTLAPADLAGLPEDVRSGMLGTWVLTFGPGNHMVTKYDGRVVEETDYRPAGNRVVFPVEDTGPYACNRLATYGWSIKNGRLSFSRVEDPCDERSVVLTTRPLEPVP